MSETEVALDLVWELGDNKYQLPTGLVERQGLGQEEVDEVKMHQRSRMCIENAMRALDPKIHVTQLRSLYDAWQENEDNLQLAWGFDLRRDMQRSYTVPHCSCPNMDNDDSLGTPYRIITEGCIFHG